MSKKNKKLIRKKFRDAVLTRDNNACKTCGTENVELDAHHITDRKQMPNGGYVLENGISLCKNCHVLAKVFHNTGKPSLGFSPEDLYKLINSNKALAVKKSLLMKKI